MFPVRKSVVTSSLLSPSSMSITRENIHCESKNPLSMRQSAGTGLHTRLRGVASSARQKLFMSWGRLWGLRSCTFSSSEKRDAHLYLSERQKNLLFILGSGRSGTQLVTQLLEASNRVAAFHEPNFFEDVATMDAFRKHPEGAMEFWRDFRSVAIYRRWRAASNKTHYAEVTGTLRYHVSTIQKLFPSCPIYLLSRDGRGVVRSVMGWPAFYGPRSRGAYPFTPARRSLPHEMERHVAI